MLHKNAPTCLFPAILIVAGLLRVVVWLQNRALYLDEASLARDICDGSVAGFFAPLLHGQFAPPFFLLLEKGAISCFGSTELALRLFPLLAGLVALPLFLGIVRRFIPSDWVLWLPVFIFSFSDFYLRFATEVKQYSLDMAVCLGLIWWALSLRRNYLLGAFWGAMSVWFSMPSVFVLFGVGIYFLADASGKKDWKVALNWLLVVSVWLTSFAGNYFLLLKNAIGEPHLQAFHSDYFLPLLPHSTADLTRWKSLMSSFPYYCAGYTAIALAFGTFGMLAGLFFLYRNRVKEGLLLVLPLAACLFASGLGQYSLLPRLLTWAFPLALVLMSYGVSECWKRTGKYGCWAWLAAMVLVASLHTGYQFFVKKFEIEDLVGVVEKVAEKIQPDDLLVIDYEAVPTFLFYRDNNRDQPFGVSKNETILTDWRFQPSKAEFTQHNKAVRRVWLVFSHIISDSKRQDVQNKLAAMRVFGTQKQVLETTGAAAYLFEW